SPSLNAARAANGHSGDVYSTSATKNATTCLSDASECNLKGRPLHQAIQSIMRKQVPGNDVCADCGRPAKVIFSHCNLGIVTHAKAVQAVACDMFSSIVEDAAFLLLERYFLTLLLPFLLLVLLFLVLILLLLLLLLLVLLLPLSRGSS
ncbi:unnamed protein product, partial [Dibothriocephalus latus]